MEFNPNEPKDVLSLIKQIEEQEGDDIQDVATFESYDYETERPIVITYYKRADPVKLKINIHIHQDDVPRVAIFNDEGRRIEHEV
ncbi:hypothetical protein [Staphylococcus sp. Marseille-Q6910]|uniref:hypothetical protein n=1 Tax=Staphylococcus sp. Marseille-Q6910 TaxID=2937990 RepID=UPI00203C3A54|nr:hypothetical protein [Staphylococcus sp. Marseille-Q6910]